MQNKKTINIVGAGLAGSECALQLANMGYKVKLWEKKNISSNEIQKSKNFSELVCSNSLRSKSTRNAAGILKEELSICNSFLLREAINNQVPADDALAVDRELFSASVTKLLRNNNNIEIIEEEYLEFNKKEIVIFCVGPLISDEFNTKIKKYIGNKNLYYLDASAPIIDFNSIDTKKIYFKSRHSNDKSHICIPLDENQFDEFFNDLKSANTVKLHNIEKEIYFKGCQPIEVMAKTSKKILLNGPMSPSNLGNDGINPYACILLRKDNVVSSMYNIVGFQTNITWPEQKRIFRKLPGLEKVKILRYGVMHKNNYINSPKVINNSFQLNSNCNWFFSGQIIGVEGYIESISSGIMTAMSVDAFLNNKKYKPFPIETMMGSLANYVTNKKHNSIKPMKCNIGLLPVLDKKVPDKDIKNNLLFERSISFLKSYLHKNK